MTDKTIRKLFDKERELAASVRRHISSLKPLRFSTDWLLQEIATGGERARDIVTLILFVEDLSAALTETIGEAEAAMNAMRQMVAQAQQGNAAAAAAHRARNQ